jgi:SAM-dependent MidA family methyltransferase
MKSISFSEFMDFALYDPVTGYYSRSPKIGRKGDFFTSVSVGSSFGQMLAYQVLEVWMALDYPVPFHLIEQGAHEGALIGNVLEELKLLSLDCFTAVHTVLVEPLATLKALQSEKMKALEVPFQHFKNWEEVPAESLTGFFYSNELLDSFPVDLVTFQKGEWFEKRVAKESLSEGYQWVLEKIGREDRLFQELGKIPKIEGYTTEIHRNMERWMESVLRGIKKGVILIVDYGYPESLYYLPERTFGTLQTYREHEKSDNPLIHVGEQDITAHVNFTLPYQSAIQGGGSFIGYTDQGRYLTMMGEKWLCDISMTHPARSSVFQKKVREFKTLTHPEMMGSRFQVLGLGKGIVEEKAWNGFRFGSRIPM